MLSPIDNIEGEWTYYDDPETAPPFDEDGHLVQWKVSRCDQLGSVVECSDKELGSGQYAEVFLGRKNGEEVAIKILCNTDAWLPTSSSSPKLPRDYRNIVRAEIETMSHLQHPHIVKFHGTFPKPSRKKKGLDLICIIMECVNGEELAKFDVFSKFSDSQFTSMVEQLVAAMDYMHERGIVHNDFHAGNVMVTDEGIVKIIDFGYAIDWSEGTPLWYSTWGHTWNAEEKQKLLRKDWERFERFLNKLIPLWFERLRFQAQYDLIEGRILALQGPASPWHMD